MNPDRWAKLQEAFHQVVDSPAAERTSVLARVCGSDIELRREVEELLAVDAGSEERLKKAIGGAVTEVVHGQHDRLIGTVIGAYKITGVLGYGGMGTVYHAERADSHFQQRVAIKLVQQMAVHPQLRSRLRAERQILASLDHPYIARLLDGGETPDGIPYLVIEHVDGKTIDAYCDEHRLGVQQRLELFEKVCAAVDYAHRNLVVHRDLKPANILVTADGTPKLLDFGIAKLLNPDPAWSTVAVTRVQDRLLTPEHASPEQVLGRTITIASDVYSLGVLLYELLCGRSPYANQNSTPLALERAICNADPPRPSALFRSGKDKAQGGTDGFDAIGTAAKRGVAIERLRRQLGGDIDEIVLKTMRKEPEQRYATAAQLADDLRRHRIGDAVLARQGGRRYRAAKFLRRNALSVGLVGVVIVALATFSVAMWIQTARLAEQRDRADRERDTANQVSGFLVDIFGAADPFRTEGQDLSVREVLESGAERIQKELGDQPEVRARMLESIGFAFERQGQHARAVPLLEQALQIRRQTEKAPSPLLATNLKNLADALWGAGNAASAEAFYLQSLAMNRELFGDRHERVAEVMIWLARVKHESASQLDEAEELLEQALEIFRERYGPDHLEVAIPLVQLANVMLWKPDLPAAERYQREALRIYQANLQRTHPDYAVTLGALGFTLLQRGMLTEAETLVTESLDLQRRVFGPQSRRVAIMLGNMSLLREKQLRYSAAIELLNEAVGIIRQISGDNDSQLGYFHDSLAHLHFKLDQPAKAEREIRHALEIYSQTLPSDHLYIASSQHLLGEVLLARRDFPGAEGALKTAIDINSRATGAANWRTARSESTLGAVLAALGRHSEAEQLLLGSYRTLLKEKGEHDELTILARQRVLAFLRSQGREREASRLLARTE